MLKARAAVVGPHRHVAEVRHGAHEFLETLAIVTLHDRMILRHRVARKPGAERVVDACAPERGILCKESFRQCARLEHADPGFQAVAACEIGNAHEVVEIRIEVVPWPDALGQFRVDKMVETGGVGVELRVVLVCDKILQRHVGLEPVDLAMGEACFGERGDVVLGVEIAGAPPVLGEAGVPMWTVPAERGGQVNACGEFFSGKVAGAAGQQPDRGEKERAVGRDNLAIAGLIDLHPDPCLGIPGLCRKVGGNSTGGETHPHAGPASCFEGCIGKLGELTCSRDFSGLRGGKR